MSKQEHSRPDLTAPQTESLQDADNPENQRTDNPPAQSTEDSGNTEAGAGE